MNHGESAAESFPDADAPSPAPSAWPRGPPDPAPLPSCAKVGQMGVVSAEVLKGLRRTHCARRRHRTRMLTGPLKQPRHNNVFGTLGARWDPAALHGEVGGARIGGVITAPDLVPARGRLRRAAGDTQVTATALCVCLSLATSDGRHPHEHWAPLRDY